MKIILFCSMLLVCCSISEAQPISGQNFREIAIKNTEIMVARLALNSQQKESIEKINIDFYEKMQSISKSQDSASAKKASVIALNAARMASFRKILSNDQFSRYQADMQVILNKNKAMNDSLRAQARVRALKQDSLIKSGKPSPTGINN